MIIYWTAYLSVLPFEHLANSIASTRFELSSPHGCQGQTDTIYDIREKSLESKVKVEGPKEYLSLKEWIQGVSRILLVQDLRWALIVEYVVFEGMFPWFLGGNLGPNLSLHFDYSRNLETYLVIRGKFTQKHTKNRKLPWGEMPFPLSIWGCLKGMGMG